MGELSAVLGWVAYTLLAVSVLMAGGIFAYNQALNKTKAAKDAQIAEAANRLDLPHVAELIRLHDRLLAAKQVLKGHSALSKAYSVIESATPTTMRFISMTLEIQGGVPKITSAAGVAKSFNALAFASSALAKDTRFRNAIFSNIAQDKDGSVAFTFSASLDPAAITFTP